MGKTISRYTMSNYCSPAFITFVVCTVHWLQRFLNKYGYMNISDPAERTMHPGDPRLTAAVGRMQGFFRLPATGKLDRRTMDMIRQPRCGCPDMVLGVGRDAVMIDKTRPVEYRIAGRRFRWQKTDLSYT